MSIIVFALWSKFITWFRYFSWSSALIRMVIESARDMIPFLVLFIFFLGAFTDGTFTLGRYNMNYETKEADDPLFNHLGMTFVHVYKTALGDWDTDSYND